GPSLMVRRARFTSRWEMVNNTRAQAIHITIANLLPTLPLSVNTSVNAQYVIEISGPGITTVTPACIVYRLVPGDQARVGVLITGSTTGSNVTIIIKNSTGKVVGTSTVWPVTALLTHYRDTASLSAHETPAWWRKAKYRIFIYWGVCDYPACMLSGISKYSNLNCLVQILTDTFDMHFSHYLHNPPNSSSPTRVHHIATYGQNILYDDFISNFTASKFNPSAWLDLSGRAGAKYFVQVTKHHDGPALLDTRNTTNRSSVRLGPKRDLLKELFDTAAANKPRIHQGTYYSLP
ncbi:glycoside hydrolase superfamily, partial [Lentinula boryana]